MNAVILKTRTEHIKEVVSNQKHALYNDKLGDKLNSGDIILISEVGSKIIRYGMLFSHVYRDNNGESSKLWGKEWPFIISGYNCTTLTRPFRISDIQVSSKIYGQGGPIVYIVAEDLRELMKRELLFPLVS